MAEFCKECFIKIEPEYIKNKKLILSKDEDLCEGCGQFKPVVVDIKIKKE